jgi:hypothetical protein
LLVYQVLRPTLVWVEGRDPAFWLKKELCDLGACQDHFPEELTAIVEDYYRQKQTAGGQ